MNKFVVIKYIVFLCFMFIVSCNDNTYKEYYPNGNIKIECQQINGEKSGVYKKYYPNGEIKVEAFYEDDKLQGVKKVYLQNGYLDWSAEYNSGLLHGLFKEYSESGELLSTSYFKDDVQDSLTVTYFSDGTIETKSYYKNGLADGDFKEYYENGNLLMYAILKEDEPLFYYKYSKAGELIESYRYINIKPDIESIKLGDKSKVDFRVYGPLSKNQHIEVLLVDMETEFEDSFKKLPLKDGKASLMIEPEIVGRHIVNARIWVDDTSFTNTKNLFVVE